MLIVNFFTYSSSDRRLLIKSGILLWLVRLGLWVLPFRILSRMVLRMKRSARMVEVDIPSIEKAAWAVRMARRFVPASTCLAQALTGQLLLGGLGQPSSVRIGVIKSADGELEAHAWLESQGKVVLGKSGDLSRFAQLPYQD